MNPIKNFKKGQIVEIWNFRTGNTFEAMITDILYDIKGEYRKPNDYIIWYITNYGKHSAFWDNKMKRWEDCEY